jgi:hypothetical protein
MLYRIVNNVRTSKVVEFYTPFVKVTPAAIKTGIHITTDHWFRQVVTVDPIPFHGPPYSTKR